MSKKNKEEKVEKRKKNSRIADGIVLLCVFLLLDLILFGVFGAAGKVVADFFVGVFGYAIYGFSLALTLLGILKTCNLRVKQSFKIVLLYSAIAILMVTFAHILSSHSFAAGNDWGTYIQNCFKNPVTAGGAIGAVFLYPFALSKIYIVSLVANGVFLFGLIIIAILLQVNIDINVERFASRKKRGRPSNGQNANVGMFDVEYTGNANAVTLNNQTIDGRDLGNKLAGNKNNNLDNYVPINKLDVGFDSTSSFNDKDSDYEETQLILDTQEIAKEAGRNDMIFAKDDINSSNIDISQAQRDIFGVDNISGMSVINEGIQDKPVEQTLNQRKKPDSSNNDTSRFDILSTNERMRIIEENSRRSRQRRDDSQDINTNTGNSHFAERLNSILNKKKEEDQLRNTADDDFSFDIEDNSSPKYEDNYIEDKTETKPIESIDDFISNTNKDKSKQDIYDKINNYDLGKIPPKSEYKQPTDGYFNKSFEPKKPVEPIKPVEQKPVSDNNSSSAFGINKSFSNAEKKQETVPQEEEKKVAAKSPYIPPSIDNLKDYDSFSNDNDDDIQEKARIIESTYANFGINVEVKHVVTGPTVTRFEFEIPPTVSVEKIPQRKGNLMLDLAVTSLRIEAPIPGKSLCGVEIPNKHRKTVGLKDFLVKDEFKNYKGGLYFALGKDIDGNCFYADLTEFPHCLIAGGTGSGKSVCLNTMLISLVYKYSPEDLRIILVDPKRVEFGKFKELPHLLTPTIYNTPKESLCILKWLVDEMTRRYGILEKNYVNNIASYNEIIGDKGEKMPYIVTIIDEVGDIMVSEQAKEFESLVLTLIQKARACGIHLILATQRPSVDVITGTIKANLPTRIAFAVTAGVNSKIILDSLGAEDLLGMGDMLYMSRKSRYLQRLQNPFINEMEVRNIMLDLTQHNQAYYDENIMQEIQRMEEPPKQAEAAVNKNFKEYNFPDELCPDVLRRIVSMDNVTISSLQRAFTIGFPRGGKIFDWLMASGYIEKNGNKQICRLTQEQVEAIIENARNKEDEE